MGLLIDGKWREDGQVAADSTGRFVRDESLFRNWVTEDGEPGASGQGGFDAEAGRYHLFVSPSCPWAHRAMILRKLKGLEEVVSMSSADRPKTAGWSYSRGIDDLQAGDDGVFRLHQAYTAAKPGYTGKVTVPTLWDRRRRTVVNNESSEIIRMFNSAFRGLAGEDYDYYPADLREEIDRINGFVYEHVNNGVYRAGFAKSQNAYEDAVTKVFHGLDTMDGWLARRRYLASDRITEADWRAFPTLLRFDLVYYGHFKCNLRRVRDYPHLSGYLRELYQWPGVRETCDLDKIKAGYYGSQSHVNPTGIVPAGPSMGHLDEPHGRDGLPAAVGARD